MLLDEKIAKNIHQNVYYLDYIIELYLFRPWNYPVLYFLNFLRWLDPVIFWRYHPTLKLSGILTFAFVVSLTHRMDNI